MSTVGDKGFTRLAKSWTRPDSLSIAFSLDPRAKWHDGKPVTAADVKYCSRSTPIKVASPVADVMKNATPSPRATRRQPSLVQEAHAGRVL